MQDNALLRLIRFTVNDYDLFRIIEKMTGCGPIGCFDGRIYRMTAGPQQDSWHDDWAENRVIAMSVNLSEQSYLGGELMLRHRDRPEKIQQIVNTSFGDALLFRLGAKLEHQVAKVRGRAPKTAYAGWFRTQPDYLTLLKQNSKKIRVFL